VNNISKSFTHKMAAKASWHRNYVTVALCIQLTDSLHSYPACECASCYRSRRRFYQLHDRVVASFRHQSSVLFCASIDWRRQVFEVQVRPDWESQADVCIARHLRLALAQLLLKHHRGVQVLRASTVASRPRAATSSS